MAEDPVRTPRLVSGAGTMLMVPMDHGISMGPAPGVTPIEATLDQVADLATCVTVHKGLVARARAYQGRLGVLMHLSASTDVGPDPHHKVLVGTVQEALHLGCDGVSIHCNLGAATEPQQLRDFGAVSTACNELSVPLVAMVYPRGPAIKNPFDARLVAHAARLGAELGADVVKVPYTGDPDSFRDVVQGAGVPVIVAGGPRRDDFEALLADLQGAAKAGARGVSIGRNVFQHPEPAKAMAAIAALFPS
jgi:predicted phospho-2-dehydro-3-deoxyheptonate aldolase